MAESSDSRTVRLEVPARPDFVILARLALGAICRLTPLTADDVADLKLAITEAAAAFVGAAADEAERLETGPAAASDPSRATDDGRLSFRFELDRRQLVLEVHGPGPVLSDEERELGRAIIEATVDDCHYSDETMRLVKYLPAPGG